jgi:hypothetical protein
MIILATLHDNNYQELATETWDNNKVKYAEKHGYAYLAKTDDFYGFPPGFEKIQFLLDTLDNYPDTEWIWWTGTDSMVTNFNIRVEDKIAEAGDAHVIMSADFNFKINCDSILVKNSDQARAWLTDIMDNMSKYHTHQFKEQQFMLDSLDKYTDTVKLMPQHFMNSYEYKMYRVMPWVYEKDTDVNGDRGQWESGDWLVHWPGTQPRERMQLVEEYKPKIIY